MDIIWHGESCITVKTKSCTVVIDPYDSGIGINLPKLKGDIVLVSRKSPGHDNAKAVEGGNKIIYWPGEYEIKGVSINAQKIPSEDKEILYFTLNTDGINVCFLGDIGKGLSEELIENIGDVDILILPVGGHGVMDAKTAHSVVEELEPRIVIPVHFAIPGLKDEYDDVDVFLKFNGVPNEPKDKLTIGSKTDLPVEKIDYVVLKAVTA